MHSTIQVRRAYEDWLNNWNWELHVTLHFGKIVDFELAFKKVKQWLKQLRTCFAYIRYCAIIFIVRRPYSGCHAHVLLLSAPNYPRTLHDLDDYMLDFIEQGTWDLGSIKITTRKEWKPEQISHYIAKEKNISLENPDNWNLDVFRKKPFLSHAKKRNGKNEL